MFKVSVVYKPSIREASLKGINHQKFIPAWCIEPDTSIFVQKEGYHNFDNYDSQTNKIL